MSKNVGLPLVCMGMEGGSHFEHSSPMSSWAARSQDSSKSNMSFVVNTSAPCPPKYTNIISNTNLFSLAEQKLLTEIPLEYKNVTTNSAPLDSVFIGLERPKPSPSYPWLTSDSEILHFRYTNSDAQLKVLFFNEAAKQDGIVVIYRTKSGDGYDAAFTPPNGISRFRQFKRGRLDGLWADFEGDHCAAWLHFVNGNAVGKWLVWNKMGSLYMEADFKESYDLIGPVNVAP